MLKIAAFVAASLITPSLFAAELNWSGGAGWRYDQANYNDGLEATNTTTGANVSKQYLKAQKIRANILGTADWHNMRAGIGLRTTSSANSNWVSTGNTVAGNAATTTVNGNGQPDTTFGLDQAWFAVTRDMRVLDFTLMIGKQKPIFAYESNSETFFDNDVRLTGLGWNADFGTFGMNAGQYTLGAVSAGPQGNTSQTYSDHSEKGPTTQSKYNMLFAWQPYFKMKLTDDISTMFALGYYLWNDASNVNNSRGGASSTAIALNTASTKAPIAQYSYRIHNPKQWQILSTWSLPYKLSASFELVKNKKSKIDQHSVIGYSINATNPQPEVSSTAWTAGLNWGKAAKAHEFSLGYSYVKKGIASVVRTYSNSSFLPDNKGHIIKGVYALADNFTLTWKGYFTKEIEKIDGSNGKSYGASNANNANQEQSTKYWELIAGVSF